MKKAQVIKLWKAFSNSTSAKEVISAFANKRGYGGPRTLERYSQAADGFKECLSYEVISKKTGWGLKYVGKIHVWWKEAFPSEAGPVTQELATRVTPTRTEHDVPKESRTKQELPEETLHKQKMLGSVQPEGETGHTPPYEDSLALLQEWRNQIQLSPIHQLLDAFLFEKRHEEFERKAIETEAVRNLYLDALGNQLEALRPFKTTILCAHTPLFKRLRDRYPESKVWQAQELFDHVRGGYFESFFSWIAETERITELFCSRVTETSASDANKEASGWRHIARMFNEAKQIDRDGFLLFRFFTLTVACDVLALGIREKKNAFWILELIGIRKLRSTVISIGSKELTKDYLHEQIISGFAFPLAEGFWGLDFGLKQKTEVLIETRQRLENAYSDVLSGLKELELTLSG